MRTRRLWFSLLGIVVVTVALFSYEVGKGNTPALGLDLQGGVSVVLEPTEPVERDELTTVADLVREAVDSLGIAEPDVRVDGDTIAVDLPGVNNQDEALELVNVTGSVALHPVLQCGLAVVDPEGPAEDASTTTTTPLAPAPSGIANPESAPTTEAPATSPPTDGDEADGGEADGDAAGNDVDGDGIDDDIAAKYPHELDDGTILMLSREQGVCQVGPPGAEGTVFSRGGAQADFLDTEGWGVIADIAGDGRDAWNAMAAECYNGAGSCPSRQLAIALDDVIQSAPTVNEPEFDDTVTITGDFGEGEARDLARILNRGAYPFDIEPTTVQTVDAQLGSESLDATIAAGLVGVALVLIYMVVYYRSLGLVIALGLVLSGVLMYAVVTFLSTQRNLAVTLSSAAGIIVSIGITVDSYIVFFERLKDDVRHGRTLRNSALRGFGGAWRTIVNGNVAGLIAALILFWLSAGSVRGFALFLGLSNVIDLLVTFFFTRPAVLLLSRTNRFGSGAALGLAARPPATEAAS